MALQNTASGENHVGCAIDCTPMHELSRLLWASRHTRRFRELLAGTHAGAGFKKTGGCGTISLKALFPRFLAHLGDDVLEFTRLVSATPAPASMFSNRRWDSPQAKLVPASNRRIAFN